MADEPKKPEDEIAALKIQLATANVRIAELEGTIRVRDEEIRFLRRPKPHKLDPAARDSFQRPFRG